MYKSLICLVTLAFVSTETNAIKLSEKSDPICSSAGCGQYKHPKKDRGYDIDYAVVYKDMSDRNDIIQSLSVQNTQNVTNPEKLNKSIVCQSEGDSINGKKEGEWSTYYRNGALKNKGKYLNDYKIGVWTDYYDTGELEKEIRFQLGKKHGRTKIFYKNGTIKALLSYKEGKEDGVSEYFDQDGHLQMKAYYKNGKEDGALEYYDKGELVNIEFWQNGILVDKN